MHEQQKKKIRILPTTYFLSSLVLSIGLHFVFPIIRLIYPPYSYLGYVFIVFGGVMNVWTDTVFKKSNTTVKPYLSPTTLITHGPFRISRHPMYLGMTAVLLGAAVIHGSLIGFVLTVLFVVTMDIGFIPLEEKKCREAFDQQYLDYQKKVRRWI